MTVQHNLDTTGWLVFPFTVNGVDYLSKIKPNTPMENRIKSVPLPLFLSINESCVRELIGNASRDEAIAKLYDLNENASEAVIEIV